jgi:hypothetical protein
LQKFPSLSQLNFFGLVGSPDVVDVVVKSEHLGVELADHILDLLLQFDVGVSEWK